jgi:hypothetical protein
LVGDGRHGVGLGGDLFDQVGSWWLSLLGRDLLRHSSHGGLPSSR